MANASGSVPSSTTASQHGAGLLRHHDEVKRQARDPHLGYLALAGCLLVGLSFAVVLTIDAAPSSGDTTAVASATGNGQTHQHVVGLAGEIPITDRDTRRLLADQLAAARRSVRGIHTTADARAHGYLPATVDLGYLGVHYLNPELAAKPFDPARPTHLIFDQDNAQGRLVGLMYYVDNKGGAPEGFAGPNDVWHTHSAACMSNGIMVALDDISAAQCTKLGGALTPLGRSFANRWMLHVWVVPGEKNPWGTFADGDPVLA